MTFREWFKKLQESFSTQMSQSTVILKDSWNKGAKQAEELKKKQRKKLKEMKEKKKDD